MWWRAALAGLLALILGCSVALAQTPSHVFRVGLLNVGANSTGICGPARVKRFVGRGYQPGAIHKIPAIYEYDWNVRDGGLMVYGPDMNAMFDRAAGLADRILKGANPAEPPLELPARLRLSINLKTAQALSLEFPESIVLRADDVIE